MLEDKSPFYRRIVAIVKAIPKGKVLTYGSVARLAGVNRGARQVSWILHSSSQVLELPWHRVLNSKGQISLPVGNGYFEQKKMLEREGIIWEGEKLDLSVYEWNPSQNKLNTLLKGIPKHIPHSLKN